jgi:hypothetical protein
VCSWTAGTSSYFVQPYVLNSQDPTQLVFWANGTGPSRPSAFYKFDIPPTVTESKHIKKPTKLFESPGDSFFLDFIAGGFTNGTADPELVIGMDNVNLHVCHFYLRRESSNIAPGLQWTGYSGLGWPGIGLACGLWLGVWLGWAGPGCAALGGVLFGWAGLGWPGLGWAGCC